MKRVSEKEFVKFIKTYRGDKKVSLNSGVSPPMIVYTDIDTGKVIARYPELTFADGYSYKDMYYEVDEECLKSCSSTTEIYQTSRKPIWKEEF